MTEHRIPCHRKYRAVVCHVNAAIQQFKFYRLTAVFSIWLDNPKFDNKKFFIFSIGTSIGNFKKWLDINCVTWTNKANASLTQRKNLNCFIVDTCCNLWRDNTACKIKVVHCLTFVTVVKS